MPVLAARRAGVRKQQVVGLFSDDFGRTDSTSVVGGGWSVAGGPMGITSGKLYASAVSSSFMGQSAIAAAYRLAGSRYTFSIDCTRINTSGWSWLLFGMDATGQNGYFMQLDSSAASPQIFKTTGGVAGGAVASPSSFTAWTGGTSRIGIFYDTATGQVKIYQGGVLVWTSLTPIEAGWKTGQYVGVMQSVSGTNYLWDNAVAV